MWRAYGATPDSQYQGATPEIFEITDILNSSVYFNQEGNPKKEFFDLVEDFCKELSKTKGYTVNLLIEELVKGEHEYVASLNTFPKRNVTRTELKKIIQEFK